MNPRSSCEDQVTAKHTEHTDSLLWVLQNTFEDSHSGRAEYSVCNRHDLGTQFVN